jgi:hypothetical protein
MTRVPRVLPSSLGPTLGGKEAAELARLESHRDWSLTLAGLSSDGMPLLYQIGKPDARTLLADCGAKISKLREGRL